MSLWLQVATQALQSGDYARLRQELLPRCPIPVPGCLSRELEFAERRCRDNRKDQLFPIRFLWLMEGNEQRLFDITPLGRSIYHPEKLLEFWEATCADAQSRRQHESEGFQFDLTERAIQMSRGWVYIGDRFIEDFLEVEAALGVELLFPSTEHGDRRPVFQAYREHRDCEVRKIADRLATQLKRGTS